MLCVCVIINKRSFEFFMCLDLIEDVMLLDSQVQSQVLELHHLVLQNVL